MYLQEVRLENIKCFEDLALDFTTARDGSPRLMTVILGENGVGKTTLLQTIALILGGGDLVIGFSLNRLDDWLRLGQQRGQVKAIVYPHTPDKIKPTKRSRPITYSLNIEDSFEFRWDEAAFVYDTNEAAYGYGPLRRFANQKVSGSKDTPISRFASLFGRNEWLISVEDWLIELDRRALLEEREGKISKYRQEFNQLAWTLLKMLPEEDIEPINIDMVEMRATAPSNYVKTTTEQGILWRDQFGNWVTLSQLSDGYQSTMAWAGDLVSRLARTYPNTESLLEQEGIVLIDEVDIHLHPTWQRKILNQLRNTFPNIQFIVTTHSPLVTASAGEGELFVLKKQQNQVVLEPEEAVQGWRADQILTSPLFGLESTRSPETEQQLARYDHLLSQKAKGQLNESETQELANLEETLRDRLPPPGETPEQRELQQQMQAYIKQILAREQVDD